MRFSFHQMERDVSQNLEWLWNQAESDLGMKSNFTVMSECVSKLGSSLWQDHFNEHIMHAISKKRELEKVYHQLSELHQAVLFAMFGWRVVGTFSAPLRVMFGEYTPIVCYLHPELNESMKKKDKTYKDKLMEEARQYYRDAIISFSDFKRKKRK